jgi:hypothetical protein
MFFNAALVFAANQRLNGGTPTVRTALAGARLRLGPIAVWSLISASVGLVLRAISQRSGLLGKIAISIVGVVWSIAAFFVLPVLIIEGIAPKAALDRSKQLMRETWGEQLIMGALLSVITVPGMLLYGFVAIFLIAYGGLAGLVLAVCGALVFIAVSTAMSTICQTVLYRFASTGTTPVGFPADSLAASFGQKKARKRSIFR